MKKELQEKLYQKYPKIFRQKDLSAQESCMHWGIACGDGWYWLIDELCSSLQFHIDHNSFKQVEARQVKEKFGGLCFYAACPDYLRGHVNFAENLSLRICEKCGSTEDVKQDSTDGWVRTRCRRCLDKEKKED